MTISISGRRLAVTPDRIDIDRDNVQATLAGLARSPSDYVSVTEHNAWSHIAVGKQSVRYFFHLTGDINSTDLGGRIFTGTESARWHAHALLRAIRRTSPEAKLKVVVMVEGTSIPVLTVITDLGS